MKFNKKFFIIGIILIFLSVVCVYASDDYKNVHDIKEILENYNESDMVGCCSVVLQLDGNNSMFSFRRDASFDADTYITEFNINGNNNTTALKQYKTNGNYFCQAIVTSDGWTFGFGGIDDGDDNKKIEKIALSMINNKSTISESKLSEIQSIKQSYGIGHFIVKAPNGNYGLATASNQETGKLEPGQYISIPNRYSFMRTGSIPMNSSDKIEDMFELAASDGFGVTRRDITTYDYHNFTNSTFNGSKVDVYLSNDDGSMHGMSTEGLRDNVNISGKYISADKIPICPKYMEIGTYYLGKEIVTPSPLEPGTGNMFYTLYLKIVILFIIALFWIVRNIVKALKYRRLR